MPRDPGGTALPRYLHCGGRCGPPAVGICGESDRGGIIDWHTEIRIGRPTAGGIFLC